MSVSIYVLKLEQNKYYIGKTQNPNFRLDQHFNGEGNSTVNPHVIKFYLFLLYLYT